MQSPTFEFSLDKPAIKDIMGTERGNLNIDWVLDFR